MKQNNHLFISITNYLNDYNDYNPTFIKCNGDCNFGWKFRKVSCVDENNKPVSASECSMKDQPERRQRCMSCNGVWKAGQWDKVEIREFNYKLSHMGF